MCIRDRARAGTRTWCGATSWGDPGAPGERWELPLGSEGQARDLREFEGAAGDSRAHGQSSRDAQAREENQSRADDRVVQRAACGLDRSVAVFCGYFLAAAY